MPTRIQRARPEEVPAIAEIERRSFSDPWSEQSFFDALASAPIYFASAHAPPAGESGIDRVVGYVVAWFTGGEGEIANLAVDPDERGRRHGAALLDAALDEAHRLGAGEIFLEVRESNARARQLYESRGFVEVGRRRKYYRRPVEDAVILRRTEGAAVGAED